MTSMANGKIVCLMANEGVERAELTEPWRAIEQAGGEPVLVSIDAGKVQAISEVVG